MPKSELTEMQQKFVDEFLVDCNVTAAAKRAGYKSKNLYLVGAKNLRSEKVRKYLMGKLHVRYLDQRTVKQTMISQLQEIAFSAESTPTQRMTATDTLLTHATRYRESIQESSLLDAFCN